VLQPPASPIFESLDQGIGVDQVIRQRVGGLRWPRVNDEVLRGQGSEFRANSPDDPQRKVHVAQRSSRRHETSGLHNHL